MWRYTVIINFMVCAPCFLLFFFHFWRVIEVSKWIFVILRKNDPSKHILGYIFPSRQQKHMGGGSFFMHSRWLNFRPDYRTVYGQVILKLLFVFWQRKQVNSPAKTWLGSWLVSDSQVHETWLFLMHFQWLSFTSCLLIVFDSY